MFLALMLAQTPTTPAETPGSGLLQFAPIIFIVLIGYFLLLRPVQRQEKQRQALVAALKKGDRVVNSGGIIGIVESIKEKEDEVVLKGGLRITKASIARVVNPEEGTKE